MRRAAFALGNPSTAVAASTALTALSNRLYRPYRLEKTPAQRCCAGVFEGMAGDGLLSHTLSSAVPSALQGLTTVFGMGTGVAPAR